MSAWFVTPFSWVHDTIEYFSHFCGRYLYPSLRSSACSKSSTAVYTLANKQRTILFLTLHFLLTSYIFLWCSCLHRADICCSTHFLRLLCMFEQIDTIMEQYERITPHVSSSGVTGNTSRLSKHHKTILF